MAKSAPDSWNPELYARHARFVSDLGAPVLALLRPLSHERILDLGCGDGVLSRKILELGCTVIGVDASPAQIEAARRAGVDARVMDGEALGFDAEFDAVFSNAALHWMKRTDKVIDGVFRALVPGGRFVAEFGGKGCVETIRRTLIDALERRGIDGVRLDPWYFPSVEEHSFRLTQGGFDVESMELFPRPTPLPTGIHGWLETFARPFTSALPADARPQFIDEVCTALTASLASPDGITTADYVRLRFVARKG
jgi:trans-aconitate methyltransferase